MSNNINHEIITIVAELQSMSPRTQLEIVRLCKRVAELTPDYIDDLTDEQYAAFTAALNQAKTELQSQITTNANDIDALEVRTGNAEDDIEANTTAINNEKTARESVVGVDAFGHTYVKTATPNKQILIENDGFIALKSNDDNALMLHPNGLAQLITADAVVECITNEGVKIKVNASSENPYELILKNNGEFEVSNGHVLKFNTNGELLIDGVSVEKHLYKLIICLNAVNNDELLDAYIVGEFYTNKVYNSIDTDNIASVLKENGYWSNYFECLNVSGGKFNDYNIIGIYVNAANSLMIYDANDTSTEINLSESSLDVKIVQIY